MKEVARRASPFLAFVIAACGATQAAPATPSAAEPAPPEWSPSATPPPVSEKPPSPPPAPPAEPAATSPAAVEEATPEKCDGGWICVRVAFETKQVLPRPTKLLGDPSISETWSKNSDGRPVSFETFSKGAVELLLRRKPGDKNEVVAKLDKSEVVLDRRDGSIEDFTHVGFIATEQAGMLLVDLRYVK
jgi:hypothetical protein